MSTELLKSLSRNGLRIFDMKELTKVAIELGLKKRYVPRIASQMIKKGSLISLRKGLYTLPQELLSGGPLHSFEIGLKIAKKGAISHRSAMSYYELTDQVFSTVYLTVPKDEGANLSTNNNYLINGTNIHLMRVSPQHYWGINTVFVGEARIYITEFEKSLIDGLTNPELCWGFREVIFAFERCAYQLKPTLISTYAHKTSLVVCKRLGWVFEQLGLYEDIQTQLKELPMPYMQKLDANGKKQGRVFKNWNLLDNSWLIL
jgi:predicted transcriptional regulator of viral defense system